MAPNLAVSGSGEVLLTWLEPVNSAAGKAHRLRLSRLAGDRWSPAVTIASGPKFFANWADFPGVIPAPDGSLVVHWLEMAGSDGYAYGIKLARSTDGGTTWSPSGSLHPEDASSEHGFVSWLPERNGVRGFWLDGREMRGRANSTAR